MKFVLFSIGLLVSCFANSNEFELAEISRANGAHEIAVKLYEASSINGNPIASYWAATYYIDGVGVDKDSKKAFKLFTHAANNEVVGAMVYLANMYYSGEGAKKDCFKSKSWISRANDGQVPKAWLGKLESCL